MIIILTLGIATAYGVVRLIKRTQGFGPPADSWLITRGFAIACGLWGFQVLAHAVSYPALDMVYSLPIVLLSVASTLLSSLVASFLLKDWRPSGIQLSGASLALSIGLCAAYYPIFGEGLQSGTSHPVWLALVASLLVAYHGLHFALRAVAQRAPEMQTRRWSPWDLAAPVGVATVLFSVQGILSGAAASPRAVELPTNWMVTEPELVKFAFRVLVLGTGALVLDELMRRSGHRRIVDTLEVLDQAVVVLSPEWTVTYVNSKACEWLAVTRDRLINRNILEAIPDLFCDQLQATALRAVDERRRLTHEGFDQRSQRWFEVHMHPTPAGLWCLAQDISERVMAAAALREQEAALERDRVRENFLRIAAHEFRNPLAGAKGMVALARRRLDRGLPTGELKTMLGMVEQEVDRVTLLLDQMLLGLRVQEGQIAVNRRPVDLVPVVTSIVEKVRAKGRLIQFTVEAETGAGVWVYGDESGLADAVQNVVTNAVKYSPDESTVFVHLSCREAEVLLAVADTGIGIPDQEVGRIFDGFFRASNLEGRDPGGMGLGLHICSQIIKHHEGRVWVESREGAGSTAYIALPRLGSKLNGTTGDA